MHEGTTTVIIQRYLDALPGFDKNVAAQIAELTGLPFVTAPNKLRSRAHTTIWYS